jgi:hypothetical protein
MKKYLGLAVFMGFMLGCGSAFAQDDGQKMQTITFEDDRIEGDLMMPNQSNINVKELDELSSLIKAREDFVDEMRKTVDEI